MTDRRPWLREEELNQLHLQLQVHLLFLACPNQVAWHPLFLRPTDYEAVAKAAVVEIAVHLLLLNWQDFSQEGCPNCVVGAELTQEPTVTRLTCQTRRLRDLHHLLSPLLQSLQVLVHRHHRPRLLQNRRLPLRSTR